MAETMACFHTNTLADTVQDICAVHNLTFLVDIQKKTGNWEENIVEPIGQNFPFNKIRCKFKNNINNLRTKEIHYVFFDVLKYCSKY